MTLNEYGCTLLCYTITMTDEYVLTIDVIGGTMTGSLIFLFVTFKEKITTTITHINTFTVKIGTVNRLTTTYRHTVITLAALTTIVPRHKKIIPSVALEDKRRLNGIRTGII